MEILKKDEKKKKFEWLQHAVAIFFIFSILIIAFYFGFEQIYKDKFYPNTKIAGINIAGETKTEAKEKLTKLISQINETGIKFNYEDQETTITPIISSFGGDVAFTVINFETDKTIEQAFFLGRNQNFWNNLLFKIQSLFISRNTNIEVALNQEQLIKILEENYNKIEKKGENATLTATSTWKNYQKEITFDISPEKIGFNLDYKKAIEILKKQLPLLNTNPIKIDSFENHPEIFKTDSLPLLAEAQKIIKKDNLNLSYGKEKWIIDDEILAGWLTLEKGIADKVVIRLSEDKIAKYLNENLAEIINKEPVDARFEIKEERVLEFTTSQDGLKINSLKTMSKIENNYILGTSTEVEIITDIEESKIKTENINNLGIKEIIGTGHSNFAGSPNNRIHNIKNGSATLNGLLIKPSEEFSLITALGEIDKENGYLPELVIKGNRTIPEYGGGLCQVGTTLFRTVFTSGLPITARRNHSYRVSYYEPAGTDATIYDPWPDFKFINDTENYILIQTRFDGNDMYFDFWGTKDGRQIEVTDPTIYNIVSPGPTKIIETTDLAPGEKKCTESAHAGADAYFDYTVTYPDGEIKEERFSSHYTPWQAVCLIGVEEKAEETETATSTEENLEQ